MTNLNRPPPVNCNGQEIDMSAFPIQRPHPNDLRLICCLIERSLLPHIDYVIDHHKHKFVMHNIAHLLCKGHLDDISALLLFHHIKLATLKEDNTKFILVSGVSVLINIFRFSHVLNFGFVSRKPP